MKYLTEEIITKIPNKRVRNKLMKLYQKNDLMLCMKNGVWWREYYSTLPNANIGIFEFRYLKKFLLKKYDLRYLYD